jgi:hypothetical protein
MFKSIKKIKEYTLLGHSMNSVAIMLNDLMTKYDSRDDDDDFKEEIYLIAYVARKGILDRLEKYEWSMEGPILVPSINPKNISLFYAYGKTILLIKSISIELNVNYEVENILKKENGYYELENVLPEQALKQIDEVLIKIKS